MENDLHGQNRYAHFPIQGSSPEYPTFLDDIEPEHIDAFDKFPSLCFNIPESVNSTNTTVESKVESFSDSSDFSDSDSDLIDLSDEFLESSVEHIDLRETPKVKLSLGLSVATLHQMKLQLYEDALLAAQRNQSEAELALFLVQEQVQLANENLLKFNAADSKEEVKEAKEELVGQREKNSETLTPVLSTLSSQMTRQMAAQVLLFFSLGTSVTMDSSPDIEGSQNRQPLKVENMEFEISHCRMKQRKCKKPRKNCAMKIHNVFQPSQW